jgi:DNA-directed RNA polymerase subunit RPC12/RpoP
VIKTIRKPKQQKPVRFECGNPLCGAELEAERTDGCFVGEQRDGSYYEFSCPHCRGRIVVSAKLFEEGT